MHAKSSHLFHRSPDFFVWLFDDAIRERRYCCFGVWFSFLCVLEKDTHSHIDSLHTVVWVPACIGIIDKIQGLERIICDGVASQGLALDSVNWGSIISVIIMGLVHCMYCLLLAIIFYNFPTPYLWVLHGNLKQERYYLLEYCNITNHKVATYDV